MCTFAEGIIVWSKSYYFLSHNLGLKGQKKLEARVFALCTTETETQWAICVPEMQQTAD